MKCFAVRILQLVFLLGYTTLASSEVTLEVKVQGKSPFDLKKIKTMIVSGPNNGCDTKMNLHLAQRVTELAGIPLISFDDALAKARPLKDPLWGGGTSMYENTDPATLFKKTYPGSAQVIAGLIPPCNFNPFEIQTDVHQGAGSPNTSKSSQFEVHADISIVDTATGKSYANSYTAISKTQASMEKSYDTSLLYAVDSIAQRFINDLERNQEMTVRLAVYDDDKWGLKSAVKMLSEHRYDEAIESLKKTIDKHSSSSDKKMLAKTYYDLGASLIAVQKFSEAVSYFKKSNELNPSPFARRLYDLCISATA